MEVLLGILKLCSNFLMVNSWYICVLIVVWGLVEYLLVSVDYIFLSIGIMVVVFELLYRVE